MSTGASAHAAASAEAPARERLMALDVVRGLTVAGMLVVNNPGVPETMPALLAHSAWHGCTLADLVFPAFLVMVGVTTQLAAARRAAPGAARAIWRRAGWLVLIGLLLNAYPFFEKREVVGPAWVPTVVGHVLARLSELRLLGVLQRIGVVYLVTALVAPRLGSRALAVVVGALLLGYWALLATVTVPGTGAAGGWDNAAATLPAWVDRQLLDWERWGLGWHLWDRALPYEPEGVLSTIPAIATAMLGVLAGRALTGASSSGAPSSGASLASRVRTLTLVGLALTAGGAAWAPLFPLNKPLWTSSYVLFTAGLTVLALAASVWVLDLRGWRRGAMPWLVFGTNPMLIYVGSELLANIFRSSIKWRVDGRLIGTGTAVTRLLEAIGVPAPMASVGWALLFTACCWALVLPLYRRGRFFSL